MKNLKVNNKGNSNNAFVAPISQCHVKNAKKEKQWSDSHQILKWVLNGDPSEMKHITAMGIHDGDKKWNGMSGKQDVISKNWC